MTTDQYIGIEIGGTKLQVVRGNAEGKILQRWRGDVDRTRGADGIREQLRLAVRQMLAAGPVGGVGGVGVGFGGPVNWQTGAIQTSHQVPGWSGFPLGQWLQELAGPGVSVTVDNDANVAALGEATAGAGVGLNPVFYVTLGSGVGGGLAVDGRIYHGAAPGECEFGHLRLDRTGQTVEFRCSGWAVDRRIAAAISANPTSPLARLVGQSTTGQARFLAQALRQNDPLAAAILAELSDDLAFALSHTVHLLHPSIIILGGGLSLLGEPLRSAVAQRLPGYVMEAFHPVPQVSLAKLGEDAVPVGALKLAK